MQSTITATNVTVVTVHVTSCYNNLQGINPREGLPKLRAQWVAARDAAGDACQTQMYYARQGVITPEMAFVAARENMEPEFVRSEVRRVECGGRPELSL